jgi:hypothetical protein
VESNKYIGTAKLKRANNRAGTLKLVLPSICKDLIGKRVKRIQLGGMIMLMESGEGIKVVRNSRRGYASVVSMGKYSKMFGNNEALIVYYPERRVVMVYP